MSHYDYVYCNKLAIKNKWWRESHRLVWTSQTRVKEETLSQWRLETYWGTLGRSCGKDAVICDSVNAGFRQTGHWEQPMERDKAYKTQTDSPLLCNRLCTVHRGGKWLLRVTRWSLCGLRRQPCRRQVLAVTSLNGVHVWPAERAAAKQHVSDECLDRRLADQSDEEHLFDDVRRHGPQRRQSQ